MTSGGPIATLVSMVLEAPPEQANRLQLQLKNCSVTRLVFGDSARYLHTFNETPHIEAATVAEYLTYS